MRGSTDKEGSTDNGVALRTHDVTSGSGIPMGAHWAACAGKHLLGMVHACMVGMVYKPMTTTQNFGQVCLQKNIR